MTLTKSEARNTIDELTDFAVKFFERYKKDGKEVSSSVWKKELAIHVATIKDEEKASDFGMMGIGVWLGVRVLTQLQMQLRENEDHT